MHHILIVGLRLVLAGRTVRRKQRPLIWQPHGRLEAPDPAELRASAEQPRAWRPCACPPQEVLERSGKWRSRSSPPTAVEKMLRRMPEASFARRSTTSCTTRRGTFSIGTVSGLLATARAVERVDAARRYAVPELPLRPYTSQCICSRPLLPDVSASALRPTGCSMRACTRTVLRLVENRGYRMKREN